MITVCLANGERLTIPLGKPVFASVQKSIFSLTGICPSNQILKRDGRPVTVIRDKAVLQLVRRNVVSDQIEALMHGNAGALKLMIETGVFDQKQCYEQTDAAELLFAVGVGIKAHRSLQSKRPDSYVEMLAEAVPLRNFIGRDFNYYGVVQLYLERCSPRMASKILLTAVTDKNQELGTLVDRRCDPPRKREVEVRLDLGGQLLGCQSDENDYN